jgi:hypothetical protein
LIVANLLYLLGAVAAIVVICSTLYLRTRKPKTMEYGIDSFKRELRALAPDEPSEREGRRPG